MTNGSAEGAFIMEWPEFVTNGGAEGSDVMGWPGNVTNDCREGGGDVTETRGFVTSGTE